MKSIKIKKENANILLIAEGSCPHCGRKSIIKSDDLIGIDRGGEMYELTILKFKKNCKGCKESFIIVPEI